MAIEDATADALAAAAKNNEAAAESAEAEEAIARGDREGLNRWWNEWRKRR